MCKKITCFLIFLLILPCIIYSKANDINTIYAPPAQDTLAPVNANGPDLDEYILFKKEDFTGTSLNKKIWGFRKEGITEQGSIYLKENAQVKNGILYLITKRFEDKFSAVNISTEKNPAYHFKYGYFEIKAKLPQTIGNVGAFWMQSPSMGATFPVANPSIYGAEIDILEYSASNKDNLFHSLHWNGYDYSKGAKVTTQQNYMPGISNGFHTFGLEWTPKEYVIYVDNVEKVRTNQTISHVPEFIIIGCGTGGFGGNLNFIGPWPDTFAIDYLKIYKRRPEVRLYGACNGYGWVSNGLQPGKYTTAQLISNGFFNDEASAVEIPKGWQMIAFDRDDCKGDFVTITADTPCLETLLFNDKISSIKIKTTE